MTPADMAAAQAGVAEAIATGRLRVPGASGAVHDPRTYPSTVLLRFIGEAGMYGHETTVEDVHYAICVCDDEGAVWHHELVTNADGSQWSTTSLDDARTEATYTPGHVVDFLPYSGRTPAIRTRETS